MITMATIVTTKTNKIELGKFTADSALNALLKALEYYNKEYAVINDLPRIMPEISAYYSLDEKAYKNDVKLIITKE